MVEPMFFSFANPIFYELLQEYQVWQLCIYGALLHALPVWRRLSGVISRIIHLPSRHETRLSRGKLELHSSTTRRTNRRVDSSLGIVDTGTMASGPVVVGGRLSAPTVFRCSSLHLYRFQYLRMIESMHLSRSRESCDLNG